MYLEDLKILKEWQDVIPEGEKFTTQHALCNLHFEDKEIEWFFETKLKDGSMYRIPRERPRLKNGAIPTMFLNFFKKGESSSEDSVESIDLENSTFYKKIKTDINYDNIPILVVPDEEMRRDSIFNEIAENLANISLPNIGWVAFKVLNYIVCSKWTKDFCIERRLVIDENLTIEVFIQSRQKQIKPPHKINSIADVEVLLKYVDSYFICDGMSNVNINKNCLGTVSKINTHCKRCKKALEQVSKKVQKKKRQKELAKNVKRNRLRWKEKVFALQRLVEDMCKKNTETEEKVFECAIANLPDPQKENIRACRRAAEEINVKRLRYSTAWIYECLLIRIKSPKAYKHLREHKILALPTAATLNKYIKRLKGVYGFQATTFTSLKKKAEDMSPSERRGCLLVDEMKVTSSISFDTSTLQFHGFVDLGKFTPTSAKIEKGNHALVFMFQPFKGSWVQALACFLSKGAASGEILHHLVIEGIILLENAGFFVDAVTSDSAAWNRNMWTRFGITTENFFSNSVASAMLFYKDECTSLKNCSGCVTFIHRFNKLIDAMNSRSPKSALRPNSEYEMRFFSMMRNACGSNDHPDSKVFLQLFRLLSTYSLVKPLKGSNITGEEILCTLLKTPNIEDESKLSNMKALLDPIIDNGTELHIFTDNVDPDHNYNIIHTSEHLVSYMAGYVARRATRFTKCTICKNSLINTAETNAGNSLIELKSKGYLINPSIKNNSLISLLEESVMNVVSEQPISIHLFGEIIRKLENQRIQLVGCVDHQYEFTFAIICFYLVTRMHFLGHRVNQIDISLRKKTKKLRKLSKLT